MNEKAGSKTKLTPKAPFKWVFMEIIPATYNLFLRSETTFSKYIVILDLYLKTPNIYGVEMITTELVMDKLDMF